MEQAGAVKYVLLPVLHEPLSSKKMLDFMSKATK
jgi:hypothetical protein